MRASNVARDLHTEQSPQGSRQIAGLRVRSGLKAGEEKKKPPPQEYMIVKITDCFITS